MTTTKAKTEDNGRVTGEVEDLARAQTVLDDANGIRVVPKGIAVKLVKILEAAGKVEKKGHNRAQNYKFVRETDLVDMIRPIMAAEKLFLNLSVVDHQLMDLYKTQSGSLMRLTILTVEGVWVDGETGEVWPIPSRFIGYGGDTGDKGVYKAMTGAEKYFLFKSFLVGTGDDPEGDEKTDRHAAGEGGPVRVRRGQPSSAQQRGGRAAKATGPQLNAITKLVRDTGLTPEALKTLIGKETGLEVPEGAKMTGAQGWLSEQTGGVAGKIIGALTELASSSEGGATEPVKRDQSWSEDGPGTAPEGEGAGNDGTTAGASGSDDTDEGDELPL